MTQPYVVTIILNTNRREDTLACIASLEKSSYTTHDIIVLDNASSDGSVAAIQAAVPAVRIIQLQANLGYAGNNNVGIRAALEQGADWVLVLNEDTIVAPTCLEQLVAIGQRSEQVGIVGPMVYHHDEPTVIQSAGGRLGPHWEAQHIGLNAPDHGQWSDPHAVDWISGCAIMVRRPVIEQVGMLDERFFYYWEETEWCIRAAKAGWQIVHVPQAKIWHKGVQRDYRPRPHVTYYNTRNQLFLLMKHRAPLRTQLYVWSQIARTLTSYSVRPKWRAARDHRDAMWRGSVDFLRRRWGAGPF